MLSRCFLDFSVAVGAFVIGLSKISSLVLLSRCLSPKGDILYTITFYSKMSFIAIIALARKKRI